MKTTANESAFTRLELLATLVVTAALLAVAWPAVASQHASAEAAICQNNHRQLIRAFLVYAADHREFLPPNPDLGSPPLGWTWVRAVMVNGGDATNIAYLRDPAHSLLSPYLGADHRVFRCPADPSTYMGKPRVRSVSMSQAVGTDPRRGREVPVAGQWLSGNHGSPHPFRTYGKLSDMVVPTPANLWIITDEAPISINDAGVAMMGYLPGMTSARWIDLPGAMHDASVSISFGDGHVELHPWKDSALRGFNGNENIAPTEDFRWISQRTAGLISEMP